MCYDHYYKLDPLQDNRMVSWVDKKRIYILDEDGTNYFLPLKRVLSKIRKNISQK